MRPPSVMRVAVVGAGPAGMYATGHLLERRGDPVEIDIFDRLPTPWGLVRSGIAPDQLSKKMIGDRLFDFYLKHPRVRFFGNVALGRDVFPNDLARWYNAVIYCSGASSDNRLGIPGESLPGVWSAREFVEFYNGHPDQVEASFDFSHERAVIVGNGNVAIDVARMLVADSETLAHTDMSDRALATLSNSKIREVVLLGRRGPEHAAFSNAELSELAELRGVNIQLQHANGEGAFHPTVLEGLHWSVRRKLDTIRALADRTYDPSYKTICFRFNASPIEIGGTNSVEQVVVAGLTGEVRGSYGGSNGLVVKTGVVFRACGYRGAPIEGLPFDHESGTVPNTNGRVQSDDSQMPGPYVSGWIKRGCRGLVGSNRVCAGETVASLISDWKEGTLGRSALTASEVDEAIRGRQPEVVTVCGWSLIDRMERQRGHIQQRPRVKLLDRQSLLAAAAGQPLPIGG